MSIDLSTIPIHLGLGGTAVPLADFGWDPERLAAYAEATRADGPDGRLVTMFHGADAWDHWERHPLGEEVVICCTGEHHFRQLLDGEEVTTVLTAGQALINPKNVWHIADSGTPGWLLTITPGQGTEHKPR